MKRQILFLVALALSIQQASSAVFLRIDDGVGTPLAASIDPSVTTSFTFSISLQSTAELTTGLDYQIGVNTLGSGLFSIIGFDRGTSTYSIPASTTNPTDTPTNILAPRNSVDLGGLRPSGTNGVGTFSVATVTISVAPGTPIGTYTFTPFSNPGEGYTDQNFDQGDFSSVDTYSLTLIPEPSTYGLIGVAGIGALGIFLSRKRMGRLS